MKYFDCEGNIKAFHRFIFWLSACSLLLTIPAFGQIGPPTEPVLRLETGMHTAKIGRISVDAASRYLVTASNDKSARIWDVATGRLLRVLRPPFGAGNEGKLFAVAISPDGNTVAVGGWTGYEWDTTHSIYLFDRESGRILRRLPNFPNVILHLVFSKNNKYMAVMLAGENGVQVYETAGWQMVGSEAGYGDDSYSVDFDRNDRLVTASFDNYIRLYSVGQSGLRLITKRLISGDLKPLMAKFSPDGSKVAVGFKDSGTVNVLSGTDLSWLYSPDTTGVDEPNLGSVAWSPDGNTLFAAGKYQRGQETPIRRWSNGGRGKYTETIGSVDTILDLLPLPDGGVIYGSGEPCWGIVDANGNRTSYVKSFIPDYRGMQERFLVSKDSAETQFFYFDSNSLARFSMVDRRLQMLDGNRPNLNPPDTTGLNITDWRDGYEPKLNGNILELDQYEISRSLAIAPDNSKFLLGTAYDIRMYDRTGKELWSSPGPGDAWAVNISGDGRLAMVAFGDGTIRWFRASDGTELLAFFPHNDRKRWVLWTPTGYYDASPDAEELIGWQVNNGKDTASDFYPVGLFRSQFYRPDIVSKILYTADETRAVALANAEAGRKQEQTDVAKQLPPVVEITSPRDGTEVSGTTVRIGYNIRNSNGEPVTNLKVLIDGRPASEARGAGNRPTNGAGEITVTIPEKDSEIALIAENRFAPSAPAVVRVKWKGKTLIADEFVVKPKLYVLAIGVSKYQNPDYNLGYAAKDAKDFTAAMVKQQGGLYREVVVKTLTDEEATRDNVVDALDWVRLQTTSKDVAMIFMAGHGTNDTLNRYYFLPYNYNSERLASTGVSFNDIKNTVEAIAGKAVFFVDTCHSGNAVGTTKARALPDINGFINELSSAENGAIVFAASTGKQVSLEDAAWNNGAFTKALVEGLSGKAEIPGKGKITINSLDLYISERVKELTKGQQTPTTSKPSTVPDFPVAAKF